LLYYGSSRLTNVGQPETKMSKKEVVKIKPGTTDIMQLCF